MDKFIVVGQGSDYGSVRWSDLKKMENAVYLESPFIKMNKIESMICHLHTSFTINSVVRLPFRRLWKRKYSLEKVGFEAQHHYYVIFTDIALGRYDDIYIKNFKKKHSNVNLILMINNAMYRRDKILKRHLQYMDIIYSFSEEDAKNYHFCFQPDIYSEVLLEDEQNISSDLFFAGNANDRADTLNAFGKYIKENHIKGHIYVQNAKKTDQKYPDIIHYNEWLNYANIMKENLHTNCILEVVGDRYTGMTLRTVEALCFHKKLLTNNTTISHMPFYNPKFIKLFEKNHIYEIDPSFITSRENVEYNYDNEYSPIAFCNRVANDYEEGIRYVPETGRV